VTCCDEVKPRHCAGLFRQTLQLRLYGPAPVLGVCFSKVHRRRSDRQIDKRHIAGIMKTMQVAVRETDNVPGGNWLLGDVDTKRSPVIGSHDWHAFLFRGKIFLTLSSTKKTRVWHCGFAK
jgi:hypothetical protein